MLNRFALLAATAAFALAGCALQSPEAEPQPDQKFEVDRLKQRFELAPSVTRVHIVNRWGDVHLKSMSDAAVGTYAVVQRIGDGAVSPRIEFLINGDSAHLEVRYDQSQPAGASGRVDLAVYLPRLSDVEVEADHGRVDGKGINANLTVITQSGSIMGSASGRLRLRSQSGDIRVKQIGGKWSGDAFLISETGLIELLIPPDSEARLDVRGNAGVIEEFGAALHVLNRESGHLQAELGSNVQKLLVQVQTRGEVVLRPFYELQ